MKLSIIIPVYNEEPFIEAVIKKVKSVELPGNMSKEIIIVNDCSTDNTINILSNYTGDPLIQIFHHKEKKGKGSAVRLGLERSSGDIILIQDADLEYDPAEYPRLLEPIIKNVSHVVFVSLFEGRIFKMPVINRLANIIATYTVRLLFNSPISDINTCYKVFRREVIKNMVMVSGGFTFDIELAVKILNRGYKILGVPISYTARTREEGKKIRWPEALYLYWSIIRYRFSS
ncbi:MAG: glycosyltransferase family 2 protein [Candidatus Omnitrophica bacterium]|nr:glycosyltransferase family 2 protein [Candidatus Omnitrophota bacterium]